MLDGVLPVTGIVTQTFINNHQTHTNQTEDEATTVDTTHKHDDIQRTFSPDLSAYFQSISSITPIQDNVDPPSHGTITLPNFDLSTSSNTDGASSRSSSGQSSCSRTSSSSSVSSTASLSTVDEALSRWESLNAPPATVLLTRGLSSDLPLPSPSPSPIAPILAATSTMTSTSILASTSSASSSQPRRPILPYDIQVQQQPDVGFDNPPILPPDEVYSHVSSARSISASSSTSSNSSTSRMYTPHQQTPSTSNTPTYPSPSLQLHRSIYHSAKSSIRFVSSYNTAVGQCMKQTQLVKRDPRLVGQLLKYFITRFIVKYWLTTLIIGGIIASIECFNQRWLFLYTPIVLIVWLIIKLAFVRLRLTTEFDSNVPMHSYQFYKHSRLISRARSYTVARLYSAAASSNGGGNSTPVTPSTSTPSSNSHPHHQSPSDIFFQPCEGYCAQASLNNLLASIPLTLPNGNAFPLRKFFVTLPPVVRPFALTEMELYINECIRASGVLQDTIEKVEILHTWDRSQASAHPGMNGGGYTDFLATLASQLNDPRYRFMANFLRTPLFFCEEERKTPHQQPQPPQQLQHQVSRRNSMSIVSSSTSSPSLASVSSTHSTITPLPSSSSSSSSISSIGLGRKLFSGHWSPLLSYVESCEVERLLFRGSLTPATGSNTPYISTPVQTTTQYAYPPSPALMKWSLNGTNSRLNQANTSSPNQQRLTPLPVSSSVLSSIPSDQVVNTAATSDATSSSSSPSASPPSLPSSSPPSSTSSSPSSSPPPTESDADSGTPLPTVGELNPLNSSSSIAAEIIAAAPAVNVTPLLPTVGLRNRSGNSCPPSSSSSSSSSSLSNVGVLSTPTPVRSISDAALHYANYLSATGATSLSYHPTERSAIGDGLILVADVNPTYGYYMIPPRRLYEAVQTVNLLDGEPRGIVRITLKQNVQP